MKAKKNIGTQSVQELFFCDSIRRTVYSNDLVKFLWLRYTARKKLGIYDVHIMLHRYSLFSCDVIIFQN